MPTISSPIVNNGSNVSASGGVFNLACGSIVVNGSLSSSGCPVTAVISTSAPLPVQSPANSISYGSGTYTATWVNYTTTGNNQVVTITDQAAPNGQAQATLNVT